MNNWQVRIIENMSRFGYDLYIFQDINTSSGRRRQILQGKDEVLELAEGTNTSEVKPTLHVPHEVLPALAKELFELGIKPDHQSKTEGRLEAQTEHLKDLRKLLKL